MASFFLVVKVVFLALVFNLANGQPKGLKIGFYEETCPGAEAIVKETIHQVLSVAPSLSGALLRLHFHDCFVRGCDGSLLLNSPTHQAEKDAIPNRTLRGFQIIDKVKSVLEKECPGVVSCADILAIVARDATSATMGPFYEVETGRRDGVVSNLTDALNDLIPPTANISTLKSGFLKKGLSVKDLVVLSGGHTIGISHCSSFNTRLYNFTGKGDTDPTLDPHYIARLKLACPPGNQNSIVEMDPGSFKTFDGDYFVVVDKRRGLFQSDAALLDDSETKSYVELQASTHGSTFFEDFGVSMINMGRIGVLTGEAGEVRKVCTVVNR